MNSKKITEAMSRICRGHNYLFGTGTVQRALCDKSGEAAAWLLPPTLCMVDGRRHGRATYSLTLYLSRRRLRRDSTEAASTADSLQDDALTIFSELSKEPFAALVAELRIKTRSCGLRPDAGVEIVVTADVETIF